MNKLSTNPDETGLIINQSTKVRISNFTNDGIEVYTKSTNGKIGFIPFCNLITNPSSLNLNDSLYVIYLGYNPQYLYFAEEELMLPSDDLICDIIQ